MRFIKKYKFAIIMTLGVLIVLSLFLYPTASEYFNAKGQSHAVTRYLEDVDSMDDSERQELLKAAQKYNKALLSNPKRFKYTKEETVEYKKLIKNSNNAIGVLTIDKINVRLPIYHGTDSAVLQIGIGHLQGSSLPVGGKGTHAIISGHRGLPATTLLSNMDKMAIDDIFVLYVMGEALTYQVDKIQAVPTSEVRALDIDPEMDYCTIVTCTPYGINTERLLVRGHRIENVGGWENVYAGANQLNFVIIILLFMIPIFPILIIILIIKCFKIRKGGIAKR